MPRRVFVSGIGAVSPLGTTTEAHLAALWAGQHGFRQITCYETDDAQMQFAGELADLHQLTLPNRKLQKILNRKDLMGAAAAFAAIKDAKLLDDNRTAPERRGAFIGSCSTQLGDFIPYFDAALQCVSGDQLSFDSNRFGRECLVDINPLAAVKVLLNGCLAHVCQQYDLRGANTNFMDGETSGLKALMAAQRAIARGDIDWALVGALSAPLDPFQMGQAAFSGQLAPQRGLTCDLLGDVVRPFDTAAIGTMLSEGAAFVILESNESCAARAQPAYAELLGISEAVSYPGEETSALARCLQSLMSKMSPRDAMLVISNASGYVQADDTEARCLNAILPILPKDTAMTTQQGKLGHTSEASALFSLIHGISMLQRQAILPCFNLREASASASTLPLVTGETSAKVQQVLTTACSRFGQTTACLLHSL